ncbi:glycosyltransferase [Candidatus Omnitrophota bacterium]
MHTTISVIIPHRNGCRRLKVLESLKEVGYPKDKIEVLLAGGSSPSVQRNRAARIAKGDILYFFNDNVELDRRIFAKAVEIFSRDKKIAGVGGPDLTPAGNTRLQHLFGFAMSSFFAHWRMRARYSQVGKERGVGQDQLLLSNLAIRRDVYLEADGFNGSLYPNEENELINRISKIGYKFVYSPEVKVYRDRRKTVFAFARQFCRYGKGRMKQIFIEGALENIQFFLPVVFIVYFLVLPLLRHSWPAFIPLFTYIFLALIDAFYLSFKNKRNLAWGLPFIYVVMHVSYGIGMLGALLETVLKKASTIAPYASNVNITKI